MVALFLRPDADQSDGAWLNESASATNLFNSVDEATSPSDTDYIVSSTTNGDKVRLRLSDPSGGVVAPFIVRYRCKRTGTQAANLIGRLYQGTSPGTLITTFTQLSVPDTFTTYTYTLTTPEFTSITDFTDLYVEFELSQQSSLKVDLNFAGGVYYDSGTVADATGVLTCTRASSGYAKNADGTLTSFASNALRIGTNGLLVEDARTNGQAFSQDLTQSGTWTLNNISIGSSSTAPDGTSTAQNVIENSSAGYHRFFNAAGQPITAAVAATGSAYIKNGSTNGRRYIGAHLSDATSGARQSVICDLVAGIISFTGSVNSPTSPSWSLETLANGWFRVSITITFAGVGGGEFFLFGCNSATPTLDAFALIQYTGDGVSNFNAWGIQVEQGAFPSSYIPTSGAAAARAAENITTSGSLQTTVNAATASLVAQVDNGSVASVAANVVDSNGTNLLGFDASNHGLASITATLATGNTANRTTQDKLGIAWTASARSLVLNGGTVATDASSQTPSATQHIGSSGSANFAYAYIERLTAWSTKLANATLQGFTA